MLPNYFIILWNNQPIGVDQNSGGYPFKTESPNLVRFWRTRKEAEDYVSLFNKEYLEVKEIQFRIMEN